MYHTRCYAQAMRNLKAKRYRQDRIRQLLTQCVGCGIFFGVALMLAVSVVW